MFLQKKEHDIYFEISSWAELNFYLQSTLHINKENTGHDLDKKLKEVGYTGKSIAELKKFEYKRLFEKEAFFSYSSTGKRIAAFVLKINGLNKARFEDIEGSITHAYSEIKKTHTQSTLLEKSYAHCIDTLDVFKP